MTVRLPGAIAARAWMKHVRLWKEQELMPPVRALVVAERFGRDSIEIVAASLALHAGRGGRVETLAFEDFVERGARWFEGTPSERRRLFVAFDAFVRWAVRSRERTTAADPR